MVNMQLKELGSTGLMVPEIGIGTSQYTGGPDPLNLCIGLGATFVDTAEMYQNEEQLGEIIGSSRDRVFLATKVLPSRLGYDELMRAAEDSLRRLAVDYVDLYQIHRPNHLVPITETMRGMEALVDAGMVKYVGVSNFSTDQLREAQEAMTKYPVVSNQVLYNLNSREIEVDLLPYCQENNITVIAYSPLDVGSLTSTPWYRLGKRSRTLREIASQTAKTPAQVALNWCISHGNVIVIPKSSTVARAAENCGASGWRLSTEQVQRLDDAFDDSD